MQPLRAKRIVCVDGNGTDGRNYSDCLPSTVGTAGAIVEGMNTTTARRYEIAMAAGQDTANARMRKAGRMKWTRADYNTAVATFNRLNPQPKETR